MLIPVLTLDEVLLISKGTVVERCTEYILTKQILFDVERTLYIYQENHILKV